MALTTAAVVSAASSAYGTYSSAKNQKKALKQQKTQNQVPQYLEDASESLVNRADALSQRKYTPFTGQRVAAFGPGEQQAQELAGAFGRQTMDRMQRGFGSKDLEQFENPYLDRVLTQRKRAIGEEFGRQEAQLSSRQSAMNAFRSGRSDLARSRLSEARLRALDEAENETRSGAFDRAMANYFTDQQVQQGAFDRAESALQATGAAERSIRQAQSDFNYGQFLEKRDWDVNNLTPLMNAIAAARGGSISTTTGGQSGGGKDLWGAAGGLLATAIQQYGMNRGGGSTTDAAQVFQSSIDQSNAAGAFGN